MDITQKETIKLKPISLSLLADTETPLTVYLKLAKGQFGSYLFESVIGGERWARYSIIGLGGQSWVKLFRNKFEYWQDKQLVKTTVSQDPFNEIKNISNLFQVTKLENLPEFSGGLVGYFSYEIIKLIEPKLAKLPDKEDPLKTPDCILMISTDLVIFDNFSNKMVLISHFEENNKDEKALSEKKLLEWKKKLNKPLKNQLLKSLDDNLKDIDDEKIKYHLPEEEYKKSIAKIKSYITQGDLMQVGLSQRMTLPFKESPIELYRAIRHINPSPYMYFIDYQDFQIVGSSPEILVRMENKQVIVRPIAGTRPRGKNQVEDLELEKDLLTDEKEISEHLMLIDLGRNDIGRICKAGSVKVSEQMIVERYSHVMHIVSNVQGEISNNTHPIEVLKATFPAGTLSGAPKIKAMEVIDELEPIKRGIYSGAVGYLGWDNNIDTAIAIRTAVIKDETIHIQVGAGIVADSEPDKEWEETLNKSKAMLKAVQFVTK